MGVFPGQTIYIVHFSFRCYRIWGISVCVLVLCRLFFTWGITGVRVVYLVVDMFWLFLLLTYSGTVLGTSS